jgi:transcriptional regulator with XRE-family HTH domain
MRAADDPDYIELIARLRRIRKNKGLSQSQLAELLGKPQSYISKVETCERRLDLVETIKLCAVLDTTFREILPEGLRYTL